jgi:DNA-directed RNA polymerase subunit RPC12/RpoP
MPLKIAYDKNVKPYNTLEKPRKQARWTLWMIWTISYLLLKYYKIKIDKSLAKNIKPPYLLICNHVQFLDFIVSAMANYPYRINNVVSIDGFNISPWLLRAVGSIPKRKFINDFALIRNIYYVLHDLKDIVGLYPEARYSFCGATSILPDSLAKLVKLCKIPVVVLIFKGHHLQKPAWAEKKRKTKLEAVKQLILSVDDIENMSIEEINNHIKKALDYNDYSYQKENNILITEEYRTEGLHKILYKCANCGKEFEMYSKGIALGCNECNSRWILKINGELECENADTKFMTIPEWYNWEREEVAKEIENNNYSFSFTSQVLSMPHPKRFVKLGEASFIQNMNGICVKGNYNGEDYLLEKHPLENYSIHVEYNFPYLKKRDVVSISTLDDTLFFIPEESQKIQKLSLATEELNKFHKRNFNL